ncbi:hypothetical protein SpCBS45565_g01651 [Spizellomyces sp. 'palustris']|nr:hypothetical protein SpCBS45565_g01651 [Spizellomyces sp. 'palustris']
MEDEWFGTEWCDFRFRVSGCKHATMWKTFYIVHSIIALPLFCLGLYLIYKKIYQRLWKQGLGIFDVIDGAVKPRATEGFILPATIHIFGRFLYTTLIAADVFKSNAVKEFFHDWPWIALWHAGVYFTIGIIYATPKSYVSGSKRSGDVSIISRSRLPSPRLLNFLLAVYLLVPTITLPLFGLLDGIARDNGNYELAATYNEIHYVLWGLYTILLGMLAIYFGMKLLLILRSNVEAVAGADGGVNNEFRRAIMMLIVSLGGTFCMEVSYGAVLFFYGILRVKILSLLPAAVFFGFNWIFASALMTYPIFITATYNLIVNKQESRARSSNNLSASLQAQQAAQRSSTRSGTVKSNHKAVVNQNSTAVLLTPLANSQLVLERGDSFWREGERGSEGPH